jgi:hypothetical protein
MFLSLSIAGVGEVFGAFLGAEGVEEFADRRVDSVDRARCGLAEQPRYTAASDELLRV